MADLSRELQERIQEAHSEIETLVAGGFPKKDADSQAHWTSRRLQALPREFDSTELWLQLVPALVHPKKLVRETALSVFTEALKPNLGLELKVETGSEDETRLRAFVSQLAQEKRRLDLYLTTFAPHCTVVVAPEQPAEKRDPWFTNADDAEAFVRKFVAENTPIFPDMETLASDILDHCSQAKKTEQAIEALRFLYERLDVQARRSLLDAASNLLADSALAKRKLGLELLDAWNPDDLAARLAPLASDKNKKIRERVTSLLEAQAIDLPEDLAEQVKGWMQEDARSGAKSLRAIHRACLAGSLPAVEYLLLRGYDVQEPDDSGETPLHYAVRSGSEELVRFLLDRSVDPNARDNRGRTPLHYLNETASAELVQILVQAGADVMAQDEFEWSVLGHAFANARPEVARHLAEQGATLGRGGSRDILRKVPPDLFDLAIEQAQAQDDSAVGGALWDDLTEGDGGRALRLYRALDETDREGHLQDVLENATLEVLQAFEEAGFIDWAANLQTDQGPFPAVVLAYRNSKPGVRDHVLERAPRLQPASEFRFEKKEEGQWRLRAGAGSLAATVIARDGGLEHLERVLSGIEPVTNRLAAEAIRKWGDTPHYLLHLFEQHAEGLDPFAPADGSHTPLLQVVLDVCTGEGRDRIEEVLLAHPAIQGYAKRHDLPQDLEILADHRASALHRQRQEALRAELPQEGEAALFLFLESGDPEKLQAALEAAGRDEHLRSSAMDRYRPLLEARLGGDAQDLEALREALPTKAEIDDLLERVVLDEDGNSLLNLGMASDEETRRVVDILGFLAARHMDMNAYEKAAIETKNADELLSLAAQWVSRLNEGLAKDTETAPEGWLARLARRLLAPAVWILLDHTHMTTWTESPLVREFLFLLGRSPSHFDLFQSIFANPPAFLWLLPEVPTFEDSDGELELPESPLPYRR